MKRSIFTVVAIAAICSGLFIFGAADKAAASAANFSDTVMQGRASGILTDGTPFDVAMVTIPPATETRSSAPTADADVSAIGKRLTRRERKEVGATFRNVRRIMKELKADGTLSPYPEIAAIQVQEVLQAESPKAFKAIGEGRDWDSFLEFLERLIELIMKFLPLFL